MYFSEGMLLKILEKIVLCQKCLEMFGLLNQNVPGEDISVFAPICLGTRISAVLPGPFCLQVPLVQSSPTNSHHVACNHEGR